MKMVAFCNCWYVKQTKVHEENNKNTTEVCMIMPLSLNKIFSLILMALIVCTEERPEKHNSIFN